MSADAVEAVRRGFRIAFSRPSLPWMPETADRRPDHGRERTAAERQRGSRCRRTSRRLRARSGQPAFDWLPNSPYSSAATAAAVRMRPMISRRRSDPLALSADSRSAWTGATRAARRAGRIDDTTVTTVPTTNATTMVRGSSWSDGARQIDPERGQQPLQAEGDPDPGEEAERRRDQAGHERLDHHRGHDLPSAGPDRPEQRHLPRALRHDDRERVEDDERAHEQRDEREDEQRGPEEPQRLLQLLRLLVGDVGRLDGLDALRERGLDARSQVRHRRAVVGDDVDLVELPDLVEHLLRGRRVERGERRTRQVVGLAEAQRARDRELLRRSLEQDLDRVADGEVVLLGRRRVDGDLRRAGRRVALDGARAATWDCRSSSRRAWEARRRRSPRPSPDRSSARIRSRSPPRPRRPARP